jgi:hypothetical protein
MPSALAERNLIDGRQLARLNGVVGFKNVALDLHILACVLRNAGHEIQGKCAIEPAELERADQIAAAILRLVGIREQNPATIASALDLRNRAFTAFVKAYDQIRRAVIYWRWDQGDADHIAPSLYAGRGNGKKKRAAPATTPAEPPAPALEANDLPPVPHPTTLVVASVVAAPDGAKTGPNAEPFMTKAAVDS